MFCAPRPVFVCTERVGSRFHVLRSRTRCQRYRGRQASFSCFASRTRFRRYRGRRVPFLSFALPISISMVPTASGSVFMFCAPGPVFGGTGGVGYRFHVLRSRTHFPRYRRRRVRFSCFALQDSISAVPRASCSVFLFCAPGLVFGGTEGIGSHFHVFRSRTHFPRYRRRRVRFSCFALPKSFSTVSMHRVPLSCYALHDSFSALPRASGAVFMFCAPRLDFGGTEGVGFRFMFCAPGVVFYDTVGVESRFYVLRSMTHFRRYRGR
jgi:hypothetical protein